MNNGHCVLKVFVLAAHAWIKGFGSKNRLWKQAWERYRSASDFDGFCDPWLLSQSKLLKYDYYLLLNTDVAWIKDDLRDTPNDREKMFLAHKFELDNLNVNYDIIEGSDFNKRFIQAVHYIRKSINLD